MTWRVIRKPKAPRNSSSRRQLRHGGTYRYQPNEQQNRHERLKSGKLDTETFKNSKQSKYRLKQHSPTPHLDSQPQPKPSSSCVVSTSRQHKHPSNPSTRHPHTRPQSPTPTTRNQGDGGGYVQRQDPIEHSNAYSGLWAGMAE